MAFDPDVLPLWVAEMDVEPCPAVVEAVTAAVRRGDTGYGWGPRYADAVARYAASAWGWEVDPAAASVVPDVMIGVAELLRLLTDEGGPVVVSPPVYDSFFGFVDAIGRRRVDAPLTAAGRLDPGTLETAFRAATASGERAAYLLCNPQNPTGVVHSPAELADAGRAGASSTGSASSPTRCTRRSSTRGVGGSRRSSPSPGPSGPSPCSRPRRGGTSRG